MSCNPPGPHFKLPPDVGHDAFERTTDNEPVVTDKITKLMWTGCSVGLTGSDCKMGTAVLTTWENSIYACDELAYGGYSDWHLPDRYEIQSIIDYGKEDPAINKATFPSMKSRTESSCQAYYTISSGSTGTPYVWSLSMEVGEVGIHSGNFST
ncbi:MAG: DUF1566 domain-containing protein, partial [Deltaproteobacteria bacterium]|nr:DUF1566 domain-containing protein [Deltaproteobacteria bacterium]